MTFIEIYKTLFFSLIWVSFFFFVHSHSLSVRDSLLYILTSKSENRLFNSFFLSVSCQQYFSWWCTLTCSRLCCSGISQLTLFVRPLSAHWNKLTNNNFIWRIAGAFSVFPGTLSTWRRTTVQCHPHANDCFLPLYFFHWYVIHLGYYLQFLVLWTGPLLSHI